MSRLMPALSDGRTFTSYLSAGQNEDMLMQRLGIHNQTHYRLFLQTNPHIVLRELHGKGRPSGPAAPHGSAGRKFR